MSNKHGTDQNIDLKNTYNVINSNRQTYDEMGANGGTLLCYEDVREVFVSRKESVFPVETYLDMGNQFSYNVKTPINIDQGVNKSYADTKLSLSGGLTTGNLDMNNNRIYNVAQPNGDNQPATKMWSENKFLDKSSGVMAGPLNMSNNKITNLASATQDGDATNKKYIDDNYLNLSGGTVTGNIILTSPMLLSHYQALSRTTENVFLCKLLIRMFTTNSIIFLWSKTRSSILETRLMLLMMLISSIWKNLMLNPAIITIMNSNT